MVFGHGLQYSFGQAYLESGLFFSDVAFRAIYSFHMPLFMMVSGFLFFSSNNKRDFRSLAASKAKGIGIPMVSFISAANAKAYLANVMQGDITGAAAGLLDEILHGTTMWFLSSLLMNMLAVAVTTRLLRNKAARYATLVSISVCGMLVPDHIVPDIHKSMFPFFLIGYAAKENGLDIYKGSRNMAAMAALAACSAAAISLFDYSTYIYTTGFCIIDTPVQQLFTNAKRIAIGVAVSYTVLQAAHLVSKKCNCKAVAHLGRISLFVYGLNIFTDKAYERIAAAMGVEIAHNYLTPAIFAACLLSAACILHNIADKNKVTRLLFLGK